MATFCRDRGIRFLVVNQPLVDEGTRSAVGMQGVEAVDFQRPARLLAEAAERARFEFVDLSAELERAAIGSPEPLLYESDGHWSPAGHQAVAAGLGPVLRRALAQPRESNAFGSASAAGHPSQGDPND
jgi:hypothetical protein